MSNPLLSSKLVQRIVALAAPDKTLSEVARAAGCDVTYVGTVISRLHLPVRRQGTSSDAARPIGLAADATAMTDRKATVVRERDGLACDELLMRLQRLHPM